MSMSSKQETLTEISSVAFIEQEDPRFWHGRWYKGAQSNRNMNDDEKPSLAWKSEKKPRNDHDAPQWLTASEFVDLPNIAQRKVSQLATLLKLSRKTVFYSGAGISRAAGINQAANGSSPSKKVSGYHAQPTFTHHALTLLKKMGYIHTWVQQNHDGLPQKAGFPQESINEIHGSWYDPSNPVVKYSGNLKTEEYNWMVRESKTADLVLVLGTSLSGLNSDRVATNTAERSTAEFKCRSTSNVSSLGMVIINLQQTVHDGKCTLRFFGQSDDILRSLLDKLSLVQPGRGNIAPRVVSTRRNRRVLVPYDKLGKRSTNGEKTWLDLEDGAKVKLTPNHNIQGAQQPCYLHIGRDKSCEGYGRVLKLDEDSCSIILKIEGVNMHMGLWWIESAIRGGPTTLPIVNA